MSEQIRQLRRVAVAGDWGSNLPWARARLHELGADGVELLLNVGDLNLTTGSSGEAYLDALEEACRVTAVTLLLTPGNHDDADYIAALELTDRHDGYGSIGWVRDHIGVLPRGHRFSVATPAGTVRSFVSLGGAASGSCAWSVPGQDWWPAEQITDEDVARAVAGGYADVMVTHEAPTDEYGTRQVADLRSANPLGFTDAALAYCAESARRVTVAYTAIASRLLFHGHLHVLGHRRLALPAPAGSPGDSDPSSSSGSLAAGSVEPVESLVVSLAADGHGGNVAIVDLDTLSVTVLMGGRVPDVTLP